MNLLWIILIISALGPLLGSFIGVIKKPSDKFMYNMLAFAAGVMLSLSFMELIPESIKLSSNIICCFGIFVGAILIYLLDIFIPHIHPGLCRQEQNSKLKRTAIFLLFGIFLHNFPEGMAIAIGSVTNFKLSFAVALAIAIHNIPEGICTSAPYYYCNRNRVKSFLVSSSTAIPIVLGFLVSYYFFQIIPLQMVGFIIAATAGLMIYISGDELIPTSCNKTTGLWSHRTIFSLILGVLFVILLRTI